MGGIGFGWRKRGWAVAALAGAGFLGCMQEEGRRPAEGAGAGLRLSLAPAALLKAADGPAPAIDSLEIRVTGEGMAPAVFGRGGDSLMIDLDGVPPGEDRLVSAWLFRRGKPLYAGQGRFAFRREARLEASLRCDPRFSRVVSRFHLPVGLPAPIRGGRLELKGDSGTFAADLEVRGEFGVFRLDEVPGDARYDVGLTLTDSAGRERYRAERPGLFLPLGEEAEWDLALAPAEAAAGLSLGLGVPNESVVRTGFPAARRGPARTGEAVVAGFYAAPAAKDSGSEGEWFSLFNRTADTLSLRGCRLSRDRGAGSARSYAFSADAMLPPGSALSFGRASSRAAVHYADFSLVNTAASLLLLCAGDSLEVDSLRYSSAAADSAAALPVKEGWATLLSAGALGQRGLRSAWCLAHPDSVPPAEPRDCAR
jgi:hypothetical protein